MARGQSALSSSSSSLSPFSLVGLLLLLNLPLGLTVGQKVHTLYWNSTSPIFHSDDPFLVNMEGHKFTFDQVGRTLSFLDYFQCRCSWFHQFHLSSRFGPHSHFLISSSKFSFQLIFLKKQNTSSLSTFAHTALTPNF